MRNSMKKLWMIMALVFTALCLLVVGVACADGDEETEDGDNLTYSVTVTTGESIDLTQITAEWKTGTTVAGSAKLGSDGKASTSLKAGAYVVSLAGIPSGHFYTPDTVIVSRTKTDAQFTVEKEVDPTAHSVAVTVSADAGVTLPEGLGVQLYSGTNAVGGPVAISSGAATLLVPNDEDYTAKLTNLPDYLTAAEASITAATESISFTVALTNIEYTVTLDAPSAIRGALKVSFANAEGSVSGATDLSFTAGTLTKSLLAGDYTVTLSGVPEGYEADRETAELSISNRSAQFTVDSTTHTVSVTVTHAANITLEGLSLSVRLYNGDTPVGAATQVTDSSATNVTMPKGNYTLRLEGLMTDTKDYLRADDKPVSTDTDSVEFTVYLDEVDYTISVVGATDLVLTEDILSEITVSITDTDSGDPVETDLHLTGTSVTKTLVAGYYTFTISVPEGYRTQRHSVELTRANRSETFTVEEKLKPPTTHDVTVHVTAGEGVTLDDCSVQLFTEDNEPFRSSVSVRSGQTVLVVPLDTTFTVKLTGLSTYYEPNVESQTIDNDTTDVYFTVTLKNVEYTVSVAADGPILSQIKVTFFRGETPVENATNLSLNNNSVSRSLPAGNYTVKLTLPEGYAAEESLTLTPESRTAQFNVHATRHSVTVTVTGQEGATVPSGLKVVVYDGDNQQVGEPINIVGGTATFYVSNDGYYTLKLEGLDAYDYLRVTKPEGISVGPDDDSAEFFIVPASVEYTVTVQLSTGASAAMLDQIKVTFKKGTSSVDGATNLSLKNGSVSVDLIADNYTVVLSGAGELFHITPEIGEVTMSSRTLTFTLEQFARYVDVILVNNTSDPLTYLAAQVFKGDDSVSDRVYFSNGKAKVVVPFGDGYTIRLVGLEYCDYEIEQDRFSVTSTTTEVTFTVDLGDIEYTVEVNAPAAILGLLKVTFYKDADFQEAVEGATDLGFESGKTRTVTLPATEYYVLITGLPDNYKADKASIRVDVANYYVTFTITGKLGIGDTLEGVELSTTPTGIELDSVPAGYYELRITKNNSNTSSQTRMFVSFFSWGDPLNDKGSSSKSQSSWTITFKLDSQTTIYLYTGSGKVTVNVALLEYELPTVTPGTPKTVPLDGVNNSSGSAVLQLVIPERAVYTLTLSSNSTVYGPVNVDIDGSLAASASNTLSITQELTIEEGTHELSISVFQLGSDSVNVTISLTQAGAAAEKQYLSVGGSVDVKITTNAEGGANFTIDLATDVGAGTYKLSYTTSDVEFYSLYMPVKAGNNTAEFSVTGGWDQATGQELPYVRVSEADITIPANCKQLTGSMESTLYAQTFTLTFYLGDGTGGGETGGLGIGASNSVTVTFKGSNGYDTIVPLAAGVGSGTYNLTFKVESGSQNMSIFWQQWSIKANSSSGSLLANFGGDNGFDGNNNLDGTLTIAIPEGCNALVFSPTEGGGGDAEVTLTLEKEGGSTGGGDVDPDPGPGGGSTFTFTIDANSMYYNYDLPISGLSGTYTLKVTASSSVDFYLYLAPEGGTDYTLGNAGLFGCDPYTELTTSIYIPAGSSFINIVGNPWNENAITFTFTFTA